MESQTINFCIVLGLIGIAKILLLYVYIKTFEKLKNPTD